MKPTTNSITDGDMIPVMEAANRLGISHNTIRRAYKNGTLDPQLRAYMIGHSLLLNRHDIDRATSKETPNE